MKEVYHIIYIVSILIVVICLHLSVGKKLLISDLRVGKLLTPYF